jgi:hypothetical protein
MIKFHGNIKDFWSTDLANYHFPGKYSAGQRDYFHPNYSKEGNNLPQGFDDQLPACQSKFFKELQVTVGTVSWTCIEPGQVIPVHTDGFYKLKTQHNVDVADCLRYLVFLQDWTFGHAVEFEETIITKWQIGDVWVFDHLSLHYAANASNINFVTCQVNNIVNNRKRGNDE